ncbi:uncharacterized protein LOC120135692 [Hibiscus syriacus]|uniref:uncharacterized protein LOC120135692 n=1 Tax=Hibiscus syriacus TaxID=106335 RepID=UPI0019208715|nr:uncharacterized protein LOC120135692 [Hibiscus syriacus]
MGYSRAIGICSVFDAELWGMLEGLKLVWECQVTSIIVETDSGDVLNTLSNAEYKGSSSSFLPHIRALLRRDWQVRFTQVPRKCDFVANGLAKLTLLVGTGMCYFREPPDCVVEVYKEESCSSLSDGLGPRY